MGQASMSPRMGIPAGHHIYAGWTADRMIHISIRKSHPPGGQCINMRRLDNCITKATHGIRTLLIWHKNQDIRSGHQRLTWLTIEYTSIQLNPENTKAPPTN